MKKVFMSVLWNVSVIAIGFAMLYVVACFMSAVYRFMGVL